MLDSLELAACIAESRARELAEERDREEAAHDGNSTWFAIHLDSMAHGAQAAADAIRKERHG
jgi:hypothetical protein